MKLFQCKSITESLTVSNPHGIHIRLATNICLLSEEYPETRVTFSLRNRKADGTNINELLALAAGYQDVLSVQIEGPKAKQLFKKLQKLFSDLDQYDGLSPEVSSFDPKNRQCGYGCLLDDRLWD